LDYARKMAESVGAEHKELLLTQEDLIRFLPEMIHLQDEPIGDPVCVPVYYVSKLARENGVIVCQVGEGSDELFCGYPMWKLKLHLQRANDWPVPAALKRVGLAGMNLLGGGRSLPYEWLRRGTFDLPVFWGGAEAFNEAEKQHLLSDSLRKQLSGLTSWDTLLPIHRRFEQKAWERSHLNWMTYVDLNIRLPELLLMRVDKMAMGVGLEGRVPFLDHKFVELAMSIPTAVKVGNGELKAILKKSVRGLIPDELIDRKKQGFGVPVHEWFLDKLGTYAEQQLREFCERTEFFDRNAVMSLIRERRAKQVWYMLNFVLWWKHYIASEPLDLPEGLTEDAPVRGVLNGAVCSS
jgi:asparagine synthase (glutamine-hydrolysing)